jgi:hypothetical protein
LIEQSLGVIRPNLTVREASHPNSDLGTFELEPIPREGEFFHIFHGVTGEKIFRVLEVPHTPADEQPNIVLVMIRSDPR